MHVICTELHEAARIDRQLIGRCGRQGDPGTYRQYCRWEDDILEVGLGPKKSKRFKNLGERSPGRHKGLSPLFRTAQREDRAAPLRRSQGADAPRKRAQKAANPNGPRPLSRHAGLAACNRLQQPLDGRCHTRCRMIAGALSTVSGLIRTLLCEGTVMFFTQRPRRAITVVELLVVIAIIGALVALLASGGAECAERSSEDELRQ